jgi:hypothetical protein
MGKAPLRAHLEAATPTRPGVPCRTCLFMESMSAEDREVLREYLASEASSRMIAEALTSYGLRISGSALARHRRECNWLE